MNHKKILLADDDPDDQFLFTDAIKAVAPGTECLAVYNGIEALRLLEIAGNLPTLIFLDLNMPCMNGIECLASIKANAALKHIPVIIFTTSANPSDVKRAEELGAVLFITKTASFKQLKETLKDILEKDFT